MRAIDLDLSLADDEWNRLRVNPERAGRAAERYARRRARETATSVIDTYRDRVETAGREARERIETARERIEGVSFETDEARRIAEIEANREARRSMRDLEKRIREIEREQAESVGTTETTAAGTAGEQQFKKQVQREFGVLIVPAWITARDERVCPICEPLDGTVEVEWGEKFRDGPPAHPRCRCYLKWEESFVLEGA